MGYIYIMIYIIMPSALRRREQTPWDAFVHMYTVYMLRWLYEH
eukprot:COSAG02_NODE_4866_length_4884_cov_2782.941902_7_plen_43_part_00